MPDPIWIGCAERNYRFGRPLHLSVDAVVIHIVDGSLAAADNTFLNPNLPNPVSAHYGIGRDGRVHRYVFDQDTAFHAGVIIKPTWTGLKRNQAGTLINPNYYTIGIEHEGGPHDDWPESMYESSAALLKDLSARHAGIGSLTRANVVMHREIRANKTCPGFKVDLNKLITMAGGTP